MAAGNDRVLTLHPAGKQGVSIAKDRYASMRMALLKVIPRRKDGVPFKDLAELVEPLLDSEVYEGASVAWYLVTVKQDLEARGLIEQVAGARPRRLRRPRRVDR